jgi:O-methyltransferase / aklanonic acid methyltransferase
VTEPRIASKDTLEQLFDGAAKSYDHTGPSIFIMFGGRLVETVPLAEGSRVLDVATGAGAVLLPAARLVGPDGHVTGIDLSGEIIKEAERAAREAGLTNTDLLKMDAEHLEFPDESFDAVLCALALFLFPDMEAALREMRRVCKPGGHIGVSVFDKTPLPFEPGLPVLLKQFVDYKVGIWMPNPVAYSTDEIEGMFSRCGLLPVASVSETSEIVYSDEEDWWAFQLTTGPGATILEMDEETRSRFKEQYLAGLRPLFSDDGLHVSVGVIYSTARRPV